MALILVCFINSYAENLELLTIPSYFIVLLYIGESFEKSDLILVIFPLLVSTKINLLEESSTRY
jgi:hypothetical protein